jgi:hypothetical protein
MMKFLFLIVSFMVAANCQDFNSLDDLSPLLVNQIQNYNPTGDRITLYRNIRETTRITIESMRRRNIQVKRDDVQKFIDRIKTEISNDIEGASDDVDSFGDDLKRQLMMDLIGMII